MPKEPLEKKKRLFGSRERHVWYVRGGYGGVDTVQSPKLVDWDLRKDSRQLSSYQMSHVLCKEHTKPLANIDSF